MKEWYLMTSDTSPNVLSGYEDSYYLDFKDDAFSESLSTDIGTTVQLCNHDLSERKSIRCIIQGNLADTHLKSMERICLFQRGTAKAGMYIFFENRYWLITGYPGTNGVYEKATIILCQYLLKWQDENKNIIERWCNITSASKYDNGEYTGPIITTTSNNFTILIPDDIDGLGLDGKRVFIDKTTHPRKVYKITRSDEVLYDYGEHGSILSFIADKDEYNPDTDNQELKICDYKDTIYTIIPTTNYTTTISGNRNIKVGFPRTYSVEFLDETGISMDIDNFSWNINSSFDIKQEVNGKKIVLSTDNEDYIGSSFLLQVIVEEQIVKEIEIGIVEGY